MQIILISALSRNHVIGRGGDLPWKLPTDMAHFRSATRGHPVLMGRKTLDSMGRKPLPARPNYVLTRDPDFRSPGVEVFTTFEAARERAESTGAQKFYVIGGGDIYSLALPHADVLDLTEVDATIEGDAFFPQFDRSQWREVSRTPHAENGWEYAFVVYERRPVES